MKPLLVILCQAGFELKSREFSGMFYIHMKLQSVLIGSLTYGMKLKLYKIIQKDFNYR